MLFAGGERRFLGAADSLPLGLGADPAAITTQLTPGDRLLLYTDGILEARDPQGRFIELEKVAEELGHGPLETVLDRIHEALLEAVGSDLADDLALLVAEYGPRRARRPMAPTRGRLRSCSPAVQAGGWTC